MFERFTERARQVVVLAQDESRALRHNYIGTEHLLLGLLREEEGLAAKVLDSFGVTIEGVRAEVIRVVGEGDEITTGQIPFTPGAKKALESSLKVAIELGHNYIGTEHILLGLARANEGAAAQVLHEVGADWAHLRDAVIGALSGARDKNAGVVAPVPPMELASLAAKLEGAKRALIAEQRFEAAASLREKQRRLTVLAQEIEAALDSPDLVLEPPTSAQGDDAMRWQYDIKPLECPTEAWVAQLAAWRRDGWELLTVVAEGDGYVTLVERRV